MNDRLLTHEPLIFWGRRLRLALLAIAMWEISVVRRLQRHLEITPENAEQIKRDGRARKQVDHKIFLVVKIQGNHLGTSMFMPGNIFQRTALNRCSWPF